MEGRSRYSEQRVLWAIQCMCGVCKREKSLVVVVLVGTSYGRRELESLRTFEPQPTTAAVLFRPHWPCSTAPSPSTHSSLPAHFYGVQPKVATKEQLLHSHKPRHSSMRTNQGVEPMLQKTSIEVPAPLRTIHQFSSPLPKSVWKGVSV